MALKIRLRQQGRKNLASYRLVVTDERSPRDGKYLEALGWYNPVESNEDKISLINEERVQYWLGLGAQMTERAASLIAKSSPSIIREQTEKKLERRAKRRTKLKALKQAK